MTREDYDLIEGGLQEAEKDDTPFLIPAEDELVVVGDANKTEINSHDFEITFRLPPEEKGWPYRVVVKKFEDVYITPRQDTKILKAITTMMPYFKAVTPQGEVTKLSSEEKMTIFDQLDDAVYDAMYDLVGFVLKIDDMLREYMIPTSVLRATLQIIQFFPEAINEADAFFE